MAWWHKARFGMFVHWGLYSVLGRHEWARCQERIPKEEYESLADRFAPEEGAPRRWVRLAKEAGQNYIVLTTKHHEGFCLFDTATTDFSAPRRAAGRDLVAEYVKEVREAGLRLGFYFSLMDWHHPDGVRCYTDESARRRFVEYTHEQVRELCTNYGKVDVLWYDVAWPLYLEGWESTRMNAMVRRLQPDIIINDRSWAPEDFSTPEQKIIAAEDGRAWEACMTLNGSWGYNRGDNDWKSARTVVNHLLHACRDGGNYLLNIGPMPDGSVPEPSVRVLREVGEWLQRNGEAVYDSEPALMEPFMYNVQGWWTVKGRVAYLHAFAWPGTDFAIGGMLNKVIDVRLLATNEQVDFTQEPERVLLRNLPREMPDRPATTIAIVCDSPPRQYTGRGCEAIKGHSIGGHPRLFKDKEGARISHPPL